MTIRTYIATPFTKDDTKKLLARAVETQKMKTDFWLACRLTSDKTYIGNINIHRRPNQEAEIGYWIAREAWNKGYATEMVGYAISFIKNMGDIQMIYATTALRNIGSQIVLEKNGFKFEKIVHSIGSTGELRESKLLKKFL